MKRLRTHSLFLFCLCGISFLLEFACASSSLPERLTHEDPAIRIRAIREISGSNQSALLPQLVERLNDDDSAVRLFAIVALEKMTGTRLGYDHSASPGERRRSMELWRNYLSQKQQVSAATESGPPSAHTTSAPESGAID